MQFAGIRLSPTVDLISIPVGTDSLLGGLPTTCHCLSSFHSTHYPAVVEASAMTESCDVEKARMTLIERERKAHGT